METRVVKLKSEFNDIINMRNIVKNVFDTLQIRIDRLTQIYADFIKTNKSENFVFGLDSFHFQSKLIDIEYDDMKRLFLAINNRMYCEYFKLHKIIVEYISKNVTDKKVSDLVKIHNFPIYKDLEPFKEYKFEIILDIHENILNLLGILISILNNKENELSIHKTKQNIGLNIDNFITSFNFNISVMREKIMMFITYIEFFHKMHSKYLKRFSNKIQLMYTHISNDIKFDDSVEITKNKKKELIDEFSTNNMDKTLLKELKTSIGSETNSEVSDTSNSTINTPNSKILEKNYSLLSLAFPSQESDIKNISTNFLNTNPLTIDREKKDYKKMFQRNVHKVTDMLQLCKPKKEQIVDKELTDKDIKEMFCGIELSCDSIINEKPRENFTLEIGNIIYTSSFDNEEIKINNQENKIEQFTPIKVNEYDIFNSEVGEKNIKETDVICMLIDEEKNKVIEEKNENKEDFFVEESKEKLINEENGENVIISSPIQTQKQSKKKRTYNKKKK